MERGLEAFTWYDPSRSRDAAYNGDVMFGDELWRAPVRSANGPAILSLQACGADQNAIYISTKDGLSLFAQALTAAFTKHRKEADSDADGWVSFQEAFALAAPVVEKLVSEKLNKKQVPQMYDGIQEPVEVLPVEEE